MQQGLHQLVEAELLYQRGLPPQATYLFKHALIQDAAYQSLAQEHPAAVPPAHCAGVGGAVSRDRGDPARAAGASLHRGGAARRRPSPTGSGPGSRRLAALGQSWKRSQHLTTGLALLATLPETPARAQQELDLQIALGPALMATKGHGGPGGGADLRPGAGVVRSRSARRPSSSRRCGAYVGSIATGGRCRRRGSWGNSSCGWRSARPTRRRLEAHDALGDDLVLPGRLRRRPDTPRAGDRPHRPDHAAGPGAPPWRTAPGVRCLSMAAHTLWCLGYPAQAVQRSQEALALAQELAHPYSLAVGPALGGLPASPPPRGAGGPGAGRGPPDPGDGAGVSALGGVWHLLARLGAGHAGPGRGGPGAAAPGPGGHPGHGADAVAAALSASCSPRPPGTLGQVEEGLRLLAEALTAFEASGRGDMLRGGVSAPGRLAATPGRPGCGPGRSLLPAGPDHRPPPAGQILGAAAAMSLAACGSSRASGPRPASCWRRSTAGSPRALTPPTSRRPRRCWRSWGDKTSVPNTLLQRGFTPVG